MPSKKDIEKELTEFMESTDALLAETAKRAQLDLVFVGGKHNRHFPDLEECSCGIPRTCIVTFYFKDGEIRNRGACDRCATILVQGRPGLFEERSVIPRDK